MLKISFWKKETGNYLSHREGLTKEQILELQQLKPGDRFILWCNQEDNLTAPDLSLKVFKARLESKE